MGIICKDADIDEAVAECALGALSFNGQATPPPPRARSSAGAGAGSSGGAAPPTTPRAPTVLAAK